MTGIAAAVLLLLLQLCHAQESKVAMYKLEILTSTDCKIPTVTAFAVQCNEGGILRLFNDDEGLDLAVCTLDGTSTAICVDEYMTAGVGSTRANAIVGCEGSTEDARLLSVTLSDDSHDCSEVPFGIGAYRRSIQVSQVCPTIPRFVSSPVQPASTSCTQGSSSSLFLACTKPNSCGGVTGPTCGTQAPFDSFGLTVTEFATTTPCLWDPTEVSTGRIDDPSNIGALEASYDVALTANSGESLYGDSCVFDAPSQITVSCGGGNLVSTDLDATPACTRISASAYDCQLDANNLAQQPVPAISVSISCQGSTREDLTIDVLWDPMNMECTQSIVGSGTSLASVGLGLQVYQTCSPFREFANTVAQQCAPIFTTKYSNYTNDSLNIDLAGELCSATHPNCHLSNQCDDEGKQKLGRLRSYVLPQFVDLFCAGGTAESNGGNGNPVQGNPETTPENGGVENGNGEEQGGDVEDENEDMVGSTTDEQETPKEDMGETSKSGSGMLSGYGSIPLVSITLTVFVLVSA